MKILFLRIYENVSEQCFMYHRQAKALAQMPFFSSNYGLNNRLGSLALVLQAV